VSIIWSAELPSWRGELCVLATAQVMLVEDKVTRELYAMKVLKKDFVIENDELSRSVSCTRLVVRRFPLP